MDENENSKQIANDYNDKHYKIDFTPHPNIFKKGIDPVLVFKQLRAFGKLNVHANYGKIPDFENLHSDECYVKFDLNLTTKKNIEEIKKVFTQIEEVADFNIKEVSAETNNITKNISLAISQLINLHNTVAHLRNIKSETHNKLESDINKILRKIAKLSKDLA